MAATATMQHHPNGQRADDIAGSSFRMQVETGGFYCCGELRVINMLFEPATQLFVRELIQLEKTNNIYSPSYSQMQQLLFVHGHSTDLLFCNYTDLRDFVN